jgi:hypothetical protein
MPKITVKVNHTLDPAVAGERLKSTLDWVKASYQAHYSDLTEVWTESGLTYSFRAMGFSIKGGALVDADAVHVDADLPFAAMMFRGTIEKTLREMVEKALARGD